MPNLDLNLPHRLRDDPLSVMPVAPEVELSRPTVGGFTTTSFPPAPSFRSEPTRQPDPLPEPSFASLDTIGPITGFDPLTMSPSTTPLPHVQSNPVLDEMLSRPTLLGAVGALPDEHSPRLTSNTDQATVPLIDFDLTGGELETSGRRTETQAGTPLAAQMGTKLDLARGYIDLGVKDGARELLEEVMRDGTREQRQQAVELIKLVEV
jgi:pilus assembly protein FimV